VHGIQFYRIKSRNNPKICAECETELGMVIADESDVAAVRG